MKIFIICPVRNATDEQKKRLEAYVDELENAGNWVHYPARDTDQNDSVGNMICNYNRWAIKRADEIHIFYDQSSGGTLFDLGMAFAMNKKIVVINKEDVLVTPQKSFANVILAWEQKQ